jgi:predicted RNA-binding Zn ribbon-like protein
MTDLLSTSAPQGQPAPANLPGGPFEFSGGALCLDFVNSWGDRGRPESDQLKGFGSLLTFAGQAGLLEEGCRRELLARAAEEPESLDLGAAFAAAVALREGLYRIFAASARGLELPANEVELLNAVLAEGLCRLRVESEPAGSDCRFAWSFAPSALPTAALWPIARSAADLLTSPDLARVSQCDGQGCTWLFLDQSRTRNRRWCSMQSCGNRAKARRHYHRSRS